MMKVVNFEQPKNLHRTNWEKKNANFYKGYSTSKKWLNTRLRPIFDAEFESVVRFYLRIPEPPNRYNNLHILVICTYNLHITIKFSELHINLHIKFQNLAEIFRSKLRILA